MNRRNNIFRIAGSLSLLFGAAFFFLISCSGRGLETSGELSEEDGGIQIETEEENAGGDGGEEEYYVFQDVEGNSYEAALLGSVPKCTYDFSYLETDEETGYKSFHDEKSGVMARHGIDVSEFQGEEIDWKLVKESGIEFVIIRLGYRAYGETGALVMDAMYEQNIQGALDAGLDVGVYFFSQSLGAIEAAEEALYVLELIEGYDLTMPVAFDWEPVEQAERYDEVDSEAITSSAIVFCEMIEDAGYTPCVYLYRYIAYYEYEMERLSEYPLWVGAPGYWDDFYYEHGMWQFSTTGDIPGIEADVDLNLQYLPVETAGPPEDSAK